MSKTSYPRISLLALTLCLAASPKTVQATVKAQSSNPICRVARLLNPKLVEVEDRLGWLQGQLRGLAVYAPMPLRSQLGWRSGRVDPEGGPPTLTLDLGDVYPLSEVYIVPAQPQPGDTGALFPLRFQLETSLDPDFQQSRVIYSTGDHATTKQDGYPVRALARDVDARFVRMIILQGHYRGTHDIAAISELVVISGDQPVSFAATATASQSMDADDSWDPSFAIDGRTPLGVWEGGKWTSSRGELIDVPADQQQVRWILDLGQSNSIDRVLLYPYMLPELAGPGVLPSQIKVYLADEPSTPPTADAISFAGGETTTPLMIPLHGQSGRFLIIHSDHAVRIGPRHIQALSEIEAWSQGRNLATNQPIHIQHGKGAINSLVELTDGYSNGLQIYPVGHWLRQLSERSEIEEEHSSLAPVSRSMATESELNATWGAAIAIGLTFLIPVAVVERRRLVSRHQIDRLRKRIASDLHDDIGSNLGSISLIARSANRDLQRLQGPDEVADDLKEVEEIARESSLAMRDIVWLLERRQDSIGDFVQRMRDTAERLLRDIDYELTCRSNRTAAKMTLEAKRHLFLYFKEVLHNILKHSQATRVTITIYDSRDRLVMEIQDNGIGLPEGDEERPASVRKLTDRAAVLHGDLHVESTSTQGTLLRLAVKRSNLIAIKEPS